MTIKVKNINDVFKSEMLLIVLFILFTIINLSV